MLCYVKVCKITFQKLDGITTYFTWLIKRFVIMMTYPLSLAGNLALAMSFFRLLVVQNKRAVCS